MASSGYFESSKYGSTKSYLRLYWDTQSQEVDNNRSYVRLRLYLYSDYRVSFSAKKSGVLDGTSFSYTGGKSGTGYVLLYTKYRWVSHTDNGSKTQSFSGNLALNITTGGGYVGTISVSGNAVLDTIPRYAVINSFTLSNATRNSFKISWSTDKNINEVQYRIGSGSWVVASTSTAKSGSFTVSGRSAGTSHSVTISVKASDSGLWTNSSAKSITTTALTLASTPTLSSRTCIQATLSWTTNQTCINIQYRIGSGSWQSTGSNFSARTSGSFTITGLAPNTTYSISIRALDAVHTGSYGGVSGGRSVTTYNTSTISSLPANINTETNFTVNIGRAITSMTHTVAMQIYRESTSRYETVKTLTGQGASAAFNLTTAEWNTALGWKPANNKWNLKFVVTTYISGVNQGNREITFTDRITVVNANPSIASVSYADIDATIQGILGDNQKILRNHSNLRVTVGQATSQKGATLKEYIITIGGNDYKANANGSNSQSGVSINIGTLNVIPNAQGIITGTIKVVDSRSNTASKNFSVQVLNYEEPQITYIEGQRENNYEAPSYLKIQARRAIVRPASTDLNLITLEYRVKENPSGTYPSTWTNVTPTNSTVSGIWQSFLVDEWIADYPNTKDYTIEVRIKDKFTAERTVRVILPKGVALMSFKEDRIEVGVPIRDKESQGRYIFFGKVKEV